MFVLFICQYVNMITTFVCMKPVSIWSYSHIILYMSFISTLYLTPSHSNFHHKNFFDMSRSEILGSSEDNFTIICLWAEMKFQAFCSLLLYFFSKMYAKNCLWYIFICVFSYFTLFCILISWHKILKIAFLRPQTGSTIIFQETRVPLYGWKISTLVKLGLKVG